MRALAILAALLLLAPPAAAGTVTLADPQGDVAFASTVVPVSLAGCSDPAIDARGLTVASDGSVLTVSLEVVDLAAPLTCAGAPVTSPFALRTWTADVLPTQGEPRVFFSLVASDATAQACTLLTWPGGGSGSATLGARSCAPAPLPSGSTVTWSLPLSGSMANLTYDLRGAAAEAQARGTRSLVLGAAAASDAVPLGPVGTL